MKPSADGSTKASNDGFKPPFGLAVNGCTVTLTLLGVSFAPGLSAPVVIMLNDVGSPTIGADYKKIFQSNKKFEIYLRLIYISF
jgi:hypothetical protein